MRFRLPPYGQIFPPFPKERRASPFWRQIYLELPEDAGLIHDAADPERIYERLDLRGVRRSAHAAIIRRARHKWKRVLLGLHARGPDFGRHHRITPPLTPNDRKILALFRHATEPHPFLAAAHRRRLRFQRGQATAFRAAWVRSGAYLRPNPSHPGSDFPSILRSLGVPADLARLPYVESSFNDQALSKTGASGLWQLALDTARLTIRVDEDSSCFSGSTPAETAGTPIDERGDPWRATLAAGTLLRTNVESLGSWELGVTAYNHGRKSLLRAIRQVGQTDLDLITRHYHQRSFGFASSQFWRQLETVLALEPTLGPTMKRETRNEPPAWIEFQLRESVTLAALWRRLRRGGDYPDPLPSAFEQSFFGLNRAIVCSKGCLPARYRLRFPEIARAEYFGSEPRNLFQKRLADLAFP